MNAVMKDPEPQLKLQKVTDWFNAHGASAIEDDAVRDLLMGAVNEWMAFAAPKLRPGDRALLGALVTAAYEMGRDAGKGVRA